MLKKIKVSLWIDIHDLKIYQLGIFIFILILIFGYLDFRIQGDGIFNDGQSGFKAMPKGMDFKAVHLYAVSIRSGIDKYLTVEGNNYPPLVTIAYIPLSFFPANLAYQLFCLILLSFLFALIYTLISEKRNAFEQCKSPVICKILFTLISVYILFQTYPVNFAFERGNYDIIAAAFAAFALLAVSRKSIILSALLLAISTQLKVYPAILAVFLFARFGLKGIGYFVIFNGIILFLLGIPGVENFISSIAKFSAKPFLWAGNHSLISFLSPFNGISYLKTYISINFFQIPLIVLFIIASIRYFYLIQGISAKNSKKRISGQFSGMELGIIGMCFCLMGLIPSVSHDYKLVIQIVPLFLLYSRSWSDLFSSKKTSIFFIIIISALIAYLFIPRFIILPFRLLRITAYVAEMKTPALLAAYFAYAFLAFKGESVVICNDAYFEKPDVSNYGQINAEHD